MPAASFSLFTTDADVARIAHICGVAGFNAEGAWPGPPDTLVSGVSGKPGEIPIEEMHG